MTKKHVAQYLALSAGAALLVVLGGCSLLGVGVPVLDGSYADYNTYRNAFPPPFPPVSARSLHFEGTPYVLSFEVECRTLPVDSVSSIQLLKVPADVDVKKWITYRNADFGNEYREIEPQRYELESGSVRLANVRVEEETHSYDGEERNLKRVYYRLEAESLSFEGGAEVPSVETEEHSCFVGDGFGTAPS